MSPRTAAATAFRNAASSRTTRSSRNHIASEVPQEKKKAPPPSTRRPLKSAISSKKSVTAKRVTRATRTNGVDHDDDASDSGTDADKEDADNDDADEPEVLAPSEIVTRKRGHQTGLSLSLSHTTLDSEPRGTKRELSTSTVDAAEARPNKLLKQDSPDRELQADAKILEDDDDDDDDEAYNAVNDISESDENPSDIERIEEQNIIATAEKRKHPSNDDWTGFTLDGVAVDDDSPFFSEHFAVTEPNSEIELTPADHTQENTSPSPNSAPTRRVRFADVASSSSSSALSADSEVDDTAFPDLILDQENLHPSTRQLFEIDDDAQQHSDESYWEFDSTREVPLPKAKDRKPQEESVDDFSGYETDSSSGQTTDEESVPPLTVHRPHTVLRISADSSRKKMAPVRRANPVARAQQQQQQQQQHHQNKQGKGPCMGTWIADPSKPIGVIHPRTKRMVYLAPRIPSLPYAGVRHNTTSSADSSPPNAYIDMSRKPWPRQTWPGAAPSRKSSDSDSSTAGHGLDRAADYMTRSVADVMMQYLPGADVTGADPFLEMEQALEMEDDEDPDEAQLDIEAFIDFGGHDSDSNEGELDTALLEELASPVTPLSSQRLPTITPKRSRGRSSSQNLLEHFDKGVVSAFRRNQSRHQAVLRRPSTGARVQAIKGGRHVAAETPITPIRKRKVERSMSSSMAPFTGINTARLRSGTA